VIPYLVHHPAWPLPAGYNPGLALAPPDRLAHEGGWRVNPLTPEQVARKRAALQKHQTQYKMSAGYLDSFLRSNELFGDLPMRALQPGSMAAFHAEHTSSEGALHMPPELTNSERAKWVGIERRAVWQERDSVVIAVEFTGRLGNDVAASAYLFGYRPDRPFAEMPKLNLRLSKLRHTVMDGSRRIVHPQAELTRTPRGFVISAPLASLGSPTHIMGSVRTYAGKVPLDWIAWRIVEVPATA
jgi:hypothetical protein